MPESTYYVREADAAPGSGYKTNGTVYTVNVTAGITADAPVMCETTDVPLNDPLGIQINKINSDGKTTADLSGAEYTITYYPKQYTSVAEIKSDTDPDVKPTVWVIQTKKHSDGSYYASLRDECIVPIVQVQFLEKTILELTLFHLEPSLLKKQKHRQALQKMELL